MAALSTIVVHDAPARRRVAVQRAVVERRALLGDCANIRDHARALVSRRYWRRPACVVPTGLRRGHGASAADLAVAVSRRLLEDMDALVDRDHIGALIYCHDAPDERISESTAGRLQYELGLAAANPFAISQAHGVALWVALDLALGLVDGPENAGAVLLVASDKLVFGGPASDARRLVFGDTAAAALVGDDALGGWAVERLVVRQRATSCDALAPWPAHEIAAFAAFGADVVEAVLSDSGVRAAALHAVLATSTETRLVDALHGRAGLRPAAAAGRRGEASSSDPLIALAMIEPAAMRGALVLAWSAGNNGEFACCVLRRL